MIELDPENETGG